MAIRDWLKRVTRTPATVAPSPIVPPATLLAKQPADAPAKPVAPSRNDVIAYAVHLSGLVNEQPEAMAFYRTTFADHPSRFVSYNDLRMQGDLLDKDALRALGLRANVKLSAQFLATLNERGRVDPLGTASVIGLIVSTALSTWRDLQNMEAAGIELAKFHASNMAAGPCAAASDLDSQRVPVSDAGMLPFETCSHPDQCACRYQSWIPLMDELGIE